MGEFGRAEPDAECPISLDSLGELYRSDEFAIPDMLQGVSELQRIRLALFCYNRAHFRKLGLTIASTVDPDRLSEFAGTMGQVLAAQCQTNGLSYGLDRSAVHAAVKPKAKISLGGRG